MKTKTFLITIIWIALAISGCKRQVDNPVTEYIPRVSTSGHTSLDVSFVDTLTQAQAQTFVASLSLTVEDFSRYDSTSPHKALVGVPDNEARKWIDSLLTFPIVVSVYGIVSVTD